MYQIIKEAQTEEIIIVNNILHSNQYKDKQVNKTPKKPLPTGTKYTKESQKYKITKWTTFTYNGKEVKQITEVFQDANLKIVFHPRNTIENI
jgi:hypothetical protein